MSGAWSAGNNPVGAGAVWCWVGTLASPCLGNPSVLQRFTQYKTRLINAHKPKPFVKPVCSHVIILRIEHNAQDMCLLKECYSFAHQTHTDSLAVHRWMDSNAYKIAKFILKRIELIANNFAVQFSHDKIRMSRSNILERKCIISPEVLETCLFDGK